MDDLQPFIKVAWNFYDTIEGTDQEKRKWQLKCLMIDALITGRVTGYFASENPETMQEIPKWVWDGRKDDEYLWQEGVLFLDPKLPDEWWQYSCSPVLVPLHGWHGSSAASAEATTKRPKPLQRREMPDEAFVTLSHAVSWLASGYAMDRAHFDWTVRREFFPSDMNAINHAIARLCDAGAEGKIEFIWRPAEEELVEKLPPLRLHDARAFDVHTDGLWVGEGWVRNNAGQLMLVDRPHFPNLTINRQQLMAACQPQKSHSKPSTAGAETRCKNWLEQQMKTRSPAVVSKATLFAEAQSKFPNLSGNAFTRAWLPLANQYSFNRPGRKKSVC